MRHDLYRFSGNHIPSAAILIRKFPSGTHTGVIYRNEEDQLWLIDFQGDGSVCTTRWNGRSPHVIPNTDSDALDRLAALCRVTSRYYRRTPKKHYYGFKRSPYGFVNPLTGELDFGPVVGGTCATFVLLLTDSARIELVRTGDDWPYRPQADAASHQRLCEVLRSFGTNSDDLDRARAELPCPRVAPQELAGAGMCPDPPADQAFAERAAEWIMDLFAHIEKHSPPPPRAA